jgi:CubicO group peptidase (beta-lactamase class C family)
MSSIDELLAAAEADVTRGWLPACQVAVARDGKLAAFATFGDATDDTRFAVFSATKPIVAAAAWVLMGEGLLDVARPVADYVPEFATHGKHAVTVEQVMLHTAGFPSPTLLAEGAHPVMRRRGFAEWPLEWEPGTRFEYHGVSAHWVLAELIERLGGMDFRDFVEQRVTSPLGLPRLLGIPPARHDACATVVPVGDMAAFDGFERAVNGPALPVWGPGDKALCAGGLRAAGVGQGGAPAAQRGRTTLTNPRAGAGSWWAGWRRGGAQRYLGARRSWCRRRQQS